MVGDNSEIGILLGEDRAARRRAYAGCERGHDQAEEDEQAERDGSDVSSAMPPMIGGATRNPK